MYAFAQKYVQTWVWKFMGRRRFRQWVWSRAKQRGVPKEGSVWSKALSKLRHGVGSKVNEVREHSYSSTCSRNQERIRN